VLPKIIPVSIASNETGEDVGGVLKCHALSIPLVKDATLEPYAAKSFPEGEIAAAA